MPLHIFAQQLMALALQQGGIGISSWRDWIGRMPGFAALEKSDVERVIRHMLSFDILSLNDGMLWFGKRGETRFGRRNFMELLSSFTSEPLFTVRYGREHLGSVDRASFMLRHDKPHVVLLGGRSWGVNQIDWNNKIVFVEPSTEEGKSRWLGNGQPLSFELCQAIKRVIEDEPPGCELSKRAMATLESVCDEFAWLKAGESTLVTTGGQTRWWTFGGLLANSALAGMLRQSGLKVGGADNFAIRIEDRTVRSEWDLVMAKIRSTSTDDIVIQVDPKMLAQLKFSDCLPEDLATIELESRLTDRSACAKFLAENVRTYSE
jgi:ATP-dependent Lhr-like helicase